MKYALLCIAFVAVLALAEDPPQYYIERYPGDGLKQRPKPAKSNERIVSREGLPEIGPSSTNTVLGTNGQTRAARYISPRVGSKEYAPSRLPEPKAQTVVMPEYKTKIAPPPKVSDKAGRDTVSEATKGSTVTNAPSPVASQPR